jgi:predicted TIM-barrel fold metal-dependent hydrolase
MHDRIDVHAHIVPPFLTEAAKTAGFGASISAGFPAWTPELALDFMDANGIASTLNSVSQPGVHYGDDRNARALARRCNEFMAGLADRYASRFGSFATLPLPDVEGALAEIVYALDVLKLDGVGLLASYNNDFLGDAAFDPVLELLNERAAAVFIHPNYHPSSKKLAMKIPAFLVEFPIDTTRAVVNLIFSGSIEKFPNIKFILAHNGGTLPYLSWRVSLAPLIDRRFQSFSQASILQAIRSFYYESAQAAGPGPMSALAEVADPGRILFGTDWPYCPTSVTQAGDESLLAAATDDTGSERMFRSNALGLFPRLGR